MFLREILVLLVLFTVLKYNSAASTSAAEDNKEQFDEISPAELGEFDETELEQSRDTAEQTSDAKRFYPQRRRVMKRCGRNRCKDIIVSIQLEWDSCVHKPWPRKFTALVPEGTVLARILEMAADKIKCYRFKTQYFPKPLGHFVTSICEITQNKELNNFWMIYESPGKLTPTGIDNFKPKDRSTTIFRYQHVRSRS